jgi:antitoxin component YwqK of YwqJK toxin-antitoxin module
MKQWNTIFISLLLLQPAFSQKDSIRKYLDESLRFTSRSQSAYPAMAFHNGDHWVLYAVYPDTSALLKIGFSDKALTIKNGVCTMYYTKDRVSQTGFFTRNRGTGQWRSWYLNGQLQTEGIMCNGYFTGVWTSYYENGQPKARRHYEDSNAASLRNPPVLVGGTGNMGLMEDFTPDGVLNGPSIIWYANGNKESEVSYCNDTLSGVCTWFRENGQPSSRETYINGKVTELDCYDSTGTRTGATCSILKLPVLLHTFFTALDYIVFELHKEKFKDIKEEGEAEVSFTVTKAGTVQQLVIKSSPDKALSKHLQKIFASMPGWSPAIVHNRAIDYPMQMIIPFYRH